MSQSQARRSLQAAHNKVERRIQKVSDKLSKMQEEFYGLEDEFRALGYALDTALAEVPEQASPKRSSRGGRKTTGRRRKGTTARRRKGTTKRATAKRTTPKASNGQSGSSGVSRKELVIQAKRLGIKGSDRMTRSAIEDAIAMTPFQGNQASQSVTALVRGTRATSGRARRVR